jgi:hypothetical protein
MDILGSAELSAAGLWADVNLLLMLVCGWLIFTLIRSSL